MSRKRKKPVRLTKEERERLEGSIAHGNDAPARQLTHARILLKADEGASSDAPGRPWPDTRIADALEISTARRSVGCASGSWGRVWRRRWSIASP